jgi:hypothetical protein
MAGLMAEQITQYVLVFVAAAMVNARGLAELLAVTEGLAESLDCTGEAGLAELLDCTGEAGLTGSLDCTEAGLAESLNAKGSADFLLNGAGSSSSLLSKSETPLSSALRRPRFVCTLVKGHARCFSCSSFL